MELLSFTGNKFDYLINSIYRILPGSEKIFAASVEDGDYCFRIKERGGETIEYEPEEKPYLYSIIRKHRINSTRFDWLSPVDIPVGEAETENTDRDLFSEADNIVLLVRLKSKEDGLSDLIYIFFRKNLSTFGLSHVDQTFKTDHKALAGYLISNFIQQAAVFYDENLANFRRLNDNVKMIIDQNEHNIERLDKIRENYGESLISFCANHLEELSLRYRRNFVLTRDAVDKIRNYSGNIALLRLVIEDAASFVNQVYFDEEEIEIKIHGWELNFEKFVVAEKQSRELHRIDNKESRAMQLLDKLEKSAEEVLRNRLPLTSANVGRFCPSPISAPAITDALKKNRKRVNLLLEKYPEKWGLIRRQFRPVRNIQENRQGKKIASSG